MFYGEQLDAELSDRSREETRIAASLVELERHPGHRLLTGRPVELATGLVERRAELRGRFEAYRARALRLGRIEEPGLLRLEEEIRRLLWTRPAELAGATRAIGAYQRLLRQASDAGRWA